MMEDDNLRQRIDTTLLGISLEERQALMSTPQGKFYSQLRGTLNPETRAKILKMMERGYSTDPVAAFRDHAEIVDFLNMQEYPLDVSEIDRLEQLSEAEGTSNPEVALFLRGSHPTYNPGAYLAYFDDWQVKEFLELTKE